MCGPPPQDSSRDSRISIVSVNCVPQGLLQLFRSSRIKSLAGLPFDRLSFSPMQVTRAISSRRPERHYLLPRMLPCGIFRSPFGVRESGSSSPGYNTISADSYLNILVPFSAEKGLLAFQQHKFSPDNPVSHPSSRSVPPLRVPPCLCRPS